MYGTVWMEMKNYVETSGLNADSYEVLMSIMRPRLRFAQ
jgi:hypothetical protein